MAEFKTPGYRDVQAQEYSGKTSVDSSKAELISGLGQVAGMAVKEHQKNQLTKDVEEVARIKTTVDDLSAQAQAQGLKSAFDDEGNVLVDIENVTPELRSQYNAVTKSAEAKFKSIAAGKAQGSLSETAAALQIEADLNARIAATPGFGPELRALARELTGYDPSGFHLRQILDIDKPTSTKLTVEQKWMQEAEAISKGMALSGRRVSPDSVYQQISFAAMKEIEVNNATRDLKLGEVNADEWLQNTRAARGINLASMMGKVAQASAEGGVSGPQDYKNLMTQVIQEEKNSFYEKFQSTGRVLSTDIQNKISESIEADYQPVIKAITDNDFGKLLDEKWETIVKLDKLYGRQMAPRLAYLTNAFGPQMASKIVDLMATTANPSQFELLISQMPGMREIIKSNGDGTKDASLKSLNVIQKVMRGDPLNAADLQYRPMAEAMMFQATTDKELHDKFVDNMPKNRGLAWLSRPGQRNIATDKDKNFMKEQFQLGMSNTVETMIQELSTNPDLYFKVWEDGKIHAFVKRGKEQNPRPIHNEHVQVMQYFVDAANNGWSDVLGVDGKQLQTELVKSLSERTEKMLKEQEKAPAATGKVNRDGDKDAEIERLNAELDKLKEKLKGGNNE